MGQPAHSPPPQVLVLDPVTYTFPLPSTATPRPWSPPLPPRKVFHVSAPLEFNFATNVSSPDVKARIGHPAHCPPPQLAELNPATYTFPLASTAMLFAGSFPLPPRKVFHVSAPLEFSFAANASRPPV